MASAVACSLRRALGRPARPAPNCARVCSISRAQVPRTLKGRCKAAAEASASGVASDDVSGPLLDPSPVNTPLVRALATIGAVAAAAGSTVFLPERWTGFIHLLAYAVYFGANIWNTFFVALTMFKVVPRQTFGKIQMKLFPRFFAVTTAMNVLLLGTLLLASTPQPLSAVVALGVALVAGLANWLWLTPLQNGLLVERYALENKANKDEADQGRIKVLYKEFGKWHGMASLANLVVLMAAAAHGWHLSGHLSI